MIFEVEKLIWVNKRVTYNDPKCHSIIICQMTFSTNQFSINSKEEANKICKSINTRKKAITAEKS